MNEFTLSRREYVVNDSVSLTVFPTDKFKTSVLKLSMAAPSDTDKKNTALFGLMTNVLRSGTEKYPERSDIIKRLNDLYDASCSIGGFASGDNRILEITSHMLSDRFSDGEGIFEGICDLVYQMLFAPKLDKRGYFRRDCVERERNTILDRIRSEKNSSREYAFKRCRELMCEGEPYGMSLDPEVLRAITPRELTDYYRDFIKKIRIKFSYVGDKNGDEIKEIIERIFGDLTFEKPQEVIPMSLKTSRSELLRVDEELDIKQGVLVIGMRTGILQGSDLSHAMCVFNNVYGGTFSSRLFKLIREKMSLCYYCNSDYVNTKGLLFVSCGIDVNNREKTEETVLSELKKLKKELISSEELEVAKKLALKELYDILDYPAAIATFHYGKEIYGDYQTVSEFIEKVKTVTAEDVRAIAETVVPDTVFFLKGTLTDIEEATLDE